MIVAGEASGDIYGANLVLAIKKLVPDIKFSTETIGDHRRIYNALQQGDAQVAEHELRQHIESVGYYLEAHEKKP